MTTKVSDMTIEELKQVIYEVIKEFLKPEGELNPKAEKILRERLSSKEWIDYNEI